jgi:hypothetical protein
VAAVLAGVYAEAAGAAFAVLKTHSLPAGLVSKVFAVPAPACLVASGHGQAVEVAWAFVGYRGVPCSESAAVDEHVAAVDEVEVEVEVEGDAAAAAAAADVVVVVDVVVAVAAAAAAFASFVASAELSTLPRT